MSTDEKAAMARKLAWFGIGLGVLELLAPRRVGEAAGLSRHAGLIRVFGAREIVSGVAVLRSRDPSAWLWGRVAGDALDGALLAAGLLGRDARRGRTAMAALLVAPVVVLDYLHARKPLSI
jgi:hypothetical protein